MVLTACLLTDPMPAAWYDVGVRSHAPGTAQKPCERSVS